MSNILGKILRVCKDNEYLFKYFDMVELFSRYLDEQDDYWRHYGIAKNKKGNFSFWYLDGHSNFIINKDNIKYLSIKQFTKDIKPRTPGIVIKHFIDKIEECIRKDITLRANIDKKVKAKMKNLEEYLEN